MSPPPLKSNMPVVFVGHTDVSGSPLPRLAPCMIIKLHKAKAGILFPRPIGLGYELFWTHRDDLIEAAYFRRVHVHGVS